MFHKYKNAEKKHPFYLIVAFYENFLMNEAVFIPFKQPFLLYFKIKLFLNRINTP